MSQSRRHDAERPLEGKVALVTGAGRGLGRAIALALAAAGAHVSLGARRADTLEATAAEVAQAGVESLTTSVDVRDEAQVTSFVDRTLDRLGDVEIVVNNAGILLTRPLLDTTEQEWDDVMGTNLRGTYLVTRAAGRHLVARGGGKVVNVASNYAFQGVSQHAAYTSSKAAVIAFTKAMAVEWARHGVQVNALAPGFFATDLNADIRADEALMAKVHRSIPARRIGRPEDLAPWVVLLASSASDFMTGEVLTIDGGEVAR